MRTAWALGAIVITAATVRRGVGFCWGQDRRGGAFEAERRPDHDRRPDGPRSVGHAAHEESAPCKGHDLQPLFRVIPALLSVAGHLLTGRYSHNHGVQNNRPPLGGYGRLDKPNTLGVWLQRRGYVTSHIGKFLNGYGHDVPADVPPGWTEWNGSVDPSTYRMWGYTLNENGTLRTYGRPNVEDPALYQTDVYRSKAVDFIHRRSGPGKPFYLSVAFLAPHGEITPPEAQLSVRSAPRHRGKFATKPLPRPPSFNEADMTDKPPAMRNRALLRPGQVNTITRNYRARQESLQAVDEAVDAIVKKPPTDRRAQQHVPDLHLRQRLLPRRTPRAERQDPRLRALLARAAYRPRAPASAAGAPPASWSRTWTWPNRPRLDWRQGQPPVDGRSLIRYAKQPARRTRRPILHEVGPFGYRAIRTSRYLWVEPIDGSRELYDRAARPPRAPVPSCRPALQARSRKAQEGTQAPSRMQGTEVPPPATRRCPPRPNASEAGTPRPREKGPRLASAHTLPAGAML